MYVYLWVYYYIFHPQPSKYLNSPLNSCVSQLQTIFESQLIGITLIEKGTVDFEYIKNEHTNINFHISYIRLL